MNGTIHEIDAQRDRWLPYREGQALTRAAGGAHMSARD